jgi:hypothetical protein
MTPILRANTGFAPGPGGACDPRGTARIGGMGGTPMGNRNVGLPPVRGTRTPMNAAALFAHLAAASRKGRDVLRSVFADGACAPCSSTLRTDKRMFVCAQAHFFLARNEGSSMKSTACKFIDRIKYDKRKQLCPKTRETRAMLGSRLKIMLTENGLTPQQPRKLLHVTPHRAVLDFRTGSGAVLSLPTAAVHAGD